MSGIKLGLFASIASSQAEIPIGQAEFLDAGTYSWTAPEGVTSVCVVCVGAGGGGRGSSSAGGGGCGGGLGWKNNITVVPGNSYTVVVGAGGARSTSIGFAGGDSYFINTSTVAGFGGAGGTSVANLNGGSYVGDGGGNGGGVPSPGIYGAGGGGAGGYSDNGGNGGASSSSGSTGAGGGGGGGGGCGSADAAGGGGGTGIYGEGNNGAFGSGSGANSFPAQGGSRGSGGSYAPGSTTRPSTGGFPGGGGGGADNTGEHGPGADGAVRIIWGEDRSFPNNAEDDLSYLDESYQNVNFTTSGIDLYNNNTKQVTAGGRPGPSSSQSWNISAMTDAISSSQAFTLEMEGRHQGQNPIMIGLTTTNSVGASYTAGNYLWYLNSSEETNGLAIYESGVFVSPAYTQSSRSDVMKIQYTGSQVIYLINDTTIRTVNISATSWRIGVFAYYQSSIIDRIRLKYD